MSHGHCGILKNSSVDNDPSLEILSRTALSQVEAGADMVAPSDMMDGRIGAIRRVLDREGLTEIPIMSYAAKLASAFYGPFRDAADSAPLEGDRQGYQMDPANGLEAMREIELDIQEGADIIMVKPAMPCLDLIRSAADQFSHPLAAYQVSGEYLMLKAAAATGGIDEKRAVLESLLAIRRAGANIILTYYALEVANWLKEK
jgi:porphobilinogen synthase